MYFTIALLGTKAQLFQLIYSNIVWEWLVSIINLISNILDILRLLIKMNLLNASGFA